jgi:hypothetical protein
MQTYIASACLLIGVLREILADEQQQPEVAKTHDTTPCIKALYKQLWVLLLSCRAETDVGIPSCCHVASFFRLYTCSSRNYKDGYTWIGIHD